MRPPEERVAAPSRMFSTNVRYAWSCSPMARSVFSAWVMRTKASAGVVGITSGTGDPSGQRDRMVGGDRMVIRGPIQVASGPCCHDEVWVVAKVTIQQKAPESTPRVGLILLARTVVPETHHVA